MVKINILYINHENSLGGGTKSLLGLIEQFKDKSDIKISVCIPKIGNGDLENELKKRNIDFIKFNYRWCMIPQNTNCTKRIIYKIFNTIVNSVTLSKLISYCKKNSIDLIHSNSMVIDIGGKLSKKLSIKHLWHIREFGEEDHRLIFLSSKKKSLKLMNVCSDKIIFISKSIEEKFSIYFDKKKTKVVYNGVEFVDVERQYEFSDNEKVKILLAGAIKKSKGQEQAILAINHLVKKGYNVVLELAGNEEDGYGDYLRKIIKDNNMIDNVKFLGFSNNLNEIRKNIDIELICSKKEAFGRVTVESMMNGNVIIGADTGATKEIINPYINGLLYKEGDIYDLADKIEYILLNPQLGKEMGQNGRALAIKEYTSKKNAENIYKIYREVTSIN